MASTYSLKKSDAKNIFIKNANSHIRWNTKANSLYQAAKILQKNDYQDSLYLGRLEKTRLMIWGYCIEAICKAILVKGWISLVEINEQGIPVLRERIKVKNKDYKLTDHNLKDLVSSIGIKHKKKKRWFDHNDRNTTLDMLWDHIELWRYPTFSKRKKYKRDWVMKSTIWYEWRRKIFQGVYEKLVEKYHVISHIAINEIPKKEKEKEKEKQLCKKFCKKLRKLFSR